MTTLKIHKSDLLINTIFSLTCHLLVGERQTYRRVGYKLEKGLSVMCYLFLALIVEKWKPPFFETIQSFTITKSKYASKSGKGFDKVEMPKL